jgi:hypothetical protein
VSAQGELVRILGNGEILIKDGETIYRGRPVEFQDPLASAVVGPNSTSKSEPPHLT